ncbi:unnamed protein product [Adineta steineri]|uniref:Uncharacterized protein n=1 Tax=Adineta steineri TaxID=433720 RepID=A0A820APV0_9BILA|nr:unnamed protein product [Adineta steineri]CAF4192925.1 unnamed protein product [Adineta steineri]
MSEQNSGNSTVEEIKRYFKEEESAAAHILQMQQDEAPLDNANESLSTITTVTPNPLDIAFVNETSDSEQSQTTRVVPKMISIGTMPKTPKTGST